MKKIFVSGETHKTLPKVFLRDYKHLLLKGFALCMLLFGKQQIAQTQCSHSNVFSDYWYINHIYNSNLPTYYQSSTLSYTPGNVYVWTSSPTGYPGSQSTDAYLYMFSPSGCATKSGTTLTGNYDTSIGICINYEPSYPYAINSSSRTEYVVADYSDIGLSPTAARYLYYIICRKYAGQNYNSFSSTQRTFIQEAIWYITNTGYFGNNIPKSNEPYYPYYQGQNNSLVQEAIDSVAAKASCYVGKENLLTFYKTSSSVQDLVMWGCGSTPCPSIDCALQINGGASQNTCTATVCAGNSVSFSPKGNDNATDGTWSWSGPGGFTSSSRVLNLSNIQSAQAGTYTVTWTKCFCTTTKTFTLSVVAPTANAGSGGTITCSTNTNGVSIGSTPIAGYSYAWSPSSGLSATDVSNPIANPSTTTVYTVTATNSTGCTASSSVTVTVDNTTPNAGSDQTRCQGVGTATLSGTSTTAGTWSSQSNNPTGATLGATNAGVATVTFTSTAIGTYHFIYSVNSCTDTMQINVTNVSCCDISQITATPGVCESTNNQYSLTGTLTFTNAPTSGTLTVSVSGGGTQVFNAPFISPQNYSIPGLTSDGISHTVTATFSSDANCSNTVTFTAPISCGCNNTPFSLCAGESYTLTAQAGYQNYQWYTVNGTTETPISGATNQTYVVTAVGIYKWKAEDGNSCPVGACCPYEFQALNCASCAVSITADPGVCNSTNNQYSLTGTLTFTNAPTSGTMTVSVSGGGTQIFNAPFTSPQSYSIPGLSSDGISHMATVSFSADVSCTNSTTYTAPESCLVQPCTVTVSASPGVCNSTNNQYSLTGTLTFTNAPTSGTLTVSVSGGGTQIFNAPFVSPQNYSIPGLTSDGISHTVTTTFSSDATCTNSTTYTAPVPCGCDNTPLPLCPGESYTMVAEPGYQNYQWYTVNGGIETPIVGATNQTYTVTVTGIYIWKATDGNSCPVGACCQYNFQAINCATCNLTVTASPGNCVPSTIKYPLNGQVTFSTPPSSGNLIVKVGIDSIIVALPLTSPYIYTIPNLPADGAAHSVIAYFSAEPTCTNSAVYTAPLPCPAPVSPCAIVANVVVNGCNSNGTLDDATDDFFTITVSATATNPGGANRYVVAYGTINPLTGAGGNVLNPGGTTYGTAVVLGTTGQLNADGTTTFDLSIRDSQKRRCFQKVTVGPVEPCSPQAPPPGCKPSLCVPVQTTKI